jgi:hypothetical protein
VAPYVDEEVAWAVEKHEALRYFADESVGYSSGHAARLALSAIPGSPHKHRLTVIYVSLNVAALQPVIPYVTFTI